MNLEILLAVSKFSAVLALGLLLVGAMRKADSATKHFALLITLGFAFLAPFVSIPGLRADLIRPEPQVIALGTPLSASLAAEVELRQASVPDTVTLLRWAYIAITLCLVFRLILGLVMVSKLRKQFPGTDLRTEFSESCQALSVRQRAKIKIAKVVGPLTFGWMKPIVVVPAGFALWPKEMRRSAILHELAHIQRFDWVWTVVVNAICSVLWCHPLVWLVRRNLRLLAEQAADERVIATGVPAPDYAGHLLAVSQCLQKPKGMVHPMGVMMMKKNTLKTRVTHILAPKSRGFTTVGALMLSTIFGISFVAVSSVSIANQDRVVEAQGHQLQVAPPATNSGTAVAGQPIRDIAIAPKQKVRSAKSKRAARAKTIIRKGYRVSAGAGPAEEVYEVQGRPLPPTAVDPFSSETIAPATAPRGTAVMETVPAAKASARSARTRGRMITRPKSTSPRARAEKVTREASADPFVTEPARPESRSSQDPVSNVNSGAKAVSYSSMARVESLDVPSAVTLPKLARLQTTYSRNLYETAKVKNLKSYRKYERIAGFQKSLYVTPPTKYQPAKINP